MIKVISKIGTSQGVIFDTALIELTGPKVGDQVNPTVAGGGSVVMTPIRRAPAAAEISSAIDNIANDYRKSFSGDCARARHVSQS